ncbi:MAG: hypothetical protein JNL76_08870 [Alphaproteobacteria bacterium]|nr:hypothetical protein [Alphaproteobacteria bacterium]
MSALTVLFCRNAQNFSACLSELNAGDSLVVLDGRKIPHLAEMDMRMLAAESPDELKNFLKENSGAIRVIATRRKDLSGAHHRVFASFLDACCLAKNARRSIITVREPVCQRTGAPTDFDLFINPALI